MTFTPLEIGLIITLCIVILGTFIFCVCLLCTTVAICDCCFEVWCPNNTNYEKKQTQSNISKC